MMRRYDWTSKLYEQIEAHASRAFCWGANDCCLFAARVVDAMCDSTHEATLSAKYNDEQTAIDYIGRSGGIASAVDTFIGEHKVKGRPIRGDVVLFDNENGETLGICLGQKIVAMGHNGVVYVRSPKVICYWSI
jgi:hypothetical protein